MKKLIKIDGIVYSIDKYYNEFVWRLKDGQGNIINIFYSLNHTYEQL